MMIHKNLAKISCILVAIILCIGLSVDGFLVIRDYSYFYSKYYISGQEVFDNMEVLEIVTVLFGVMVFLSILNMLTNLSKLLSTLNIGISVVALVICVVGFVGYINEFSYVSFGLMGCVYIGLLLFNIVANLFSS